MKGCGLTNRDESCYFEGGASDINDRLDISQQLHPLKKSISVSIALTRRSPFDLNSRSNILLQMRNDSEKGTYFNITE